MVEGGQRAETVTVSQAAKILRLHRNTIHNYIKQGRLRASKTMEGGREYYLIERNSLPMCNRAYISNHWMLNHPLCIVK